MASPARIEVDKLSVEQLKALKERTDLEVNLLQDSLGKIRTAATRLENATAALHELSLRPQGTAHQTLTPSSLSLSLFFAGTLFSTGFHLLALSTGGLLTFSPAARCVPGRSCLCRSQRPSMCPACSTTPRRRWRPSASPPLPWIYAGGPHPLLPFRGSALEALTLSSPPADQRWMPSLTTLQPAGSAPPLSLLMFSFFSNLKEELGGLSMKKSVACWFVTCVCRDNKKGDSNTVRLWGISSSSDHQRSLPLSGSGVKDHWQREMDGLLDPAAITCNGSRTILN